MPGGGGQGGCIWSGMERGRRPFTEQALCQQYSGGRAKAVQAGEESEDGQRRHSDIELPGNYTGEASLGPL